MRNREDLPFALGTDFEHENKIRDISKLFKIKRTVF